MKSLVCANFGECKKVLTDKDVKIKIGKYTFCEECAKKRKS